MRTGGTSWNSSKGPFLNDIYTEGGRGLTKCRRSKGGCVDLVLWILPKCTEIGKKAWLFAKLQPGRARKRINAT